MGGFEQKPGGSTLVSQASSPGQLGTTSDVSVAPGKRTLTSKLDDHARGQGATGSRVSNRTAGPIAGVEKTGFVDNSKGATIYDGPAESSGQPIREAPLPPAARVFVSGTHPHASHWWYVTAFLDQEMLRGYVEDFRINIALPEPFAELRQLVGDETAEGLAREKFGSAVTDGHDLRYYENVLLYVNHGRKGIVGTYQDPGILRRGDNNIQLIKDHRIWLVSAEYARTLEGIVPSGSLTGGAVAKAKRFAGHLEDILLSVTESPHHFGEVAAESAEAIREHLSVVIGITAGFLTAEAGSMLLAVIPTGVTQIAAAVIQLLLSALGAAGMVEAGVEALKHGCLWLTTSWTAKGEPVMIAAASREFVRMLVAIAVAALSRTGARGNYRSALAIANKLPTRALPALANASSSVNGSAVTATAIAPSSGAAAVTGNAALRVPDNKDDPGSLFDDYGPEASYKDEPNAHGDDGVPDSELDPEMASENGMGALHSARLGIERTPRHHLLPQTELPFFQKRGFPGRDIDRFCVDFDDPLDHVILHGGNQHLARTHWSDREWSTALMRELRKDENALGRQLRRDEILATMDKQRRVFNIADRPIVRYRSRR